MEKPIKYDEYMKDLYPDRYNGKTYNYATHKWETEGFKEKAKKEKKSKRKICKKKREAAILRDEGKCVECGGADHLHVHHIKHREHGGNDNPDNLVTLCAWCHAEKHKGEPVYKIMMRVSVQIDNGARAWR